ncbi:polyhedral envelope protein [Malacosoma neustria nucleopolyhedrovirus]|uniref:polyhedral envelope protein n=1 Tax=Malacosoma neustria nuclear polyhedrosis virus TaxID=38012 RepID=UPI000E35C181|nr:polyhedral envelope protein [Malacosoma neustria nucleopolyhedrovirus]AUF81634.1 polyhedral envelope protein [Malacosoma neustria nucleopolyhedrovirus]
MSSNVMLRKVHDCNVAAFVDCEWVVWISADETLQLLRLPSSALQAVPPRHKKCWVDLKNITSHTHCRVEQNKLFIDNYGLGILCSRACVVNVCDYLMTQFIAEIYKEHSAEVSSASSSSFLPPPSSNTECRPSPPPHHHDALERIARQNDIIINALNQLSVSNSNQHLDIINQLNAIRLQNSTTSSQLTTIIDLFENQLGSLIKDLNKLLSDLDTRFENILETINTALAQFQTTIRNELTNVNAVLNNLASSVTNINATLNNILQILNNLDVGALNARLDTIVGLLNDILSMFTPELLAKIKQHATRNIE